MESFFHTLKSELVHYRSYTTRAEAQRDIFAFIEGFYNEERPHGAIGNRPPILLHNHVGASRQRDRGAKL